MLFHIVATLLNYALFITKLKEFDNFGQFCNSASDGQLRVFLAYIVVPVPVIYVNRKRTCSILRSVDISAQGELKQKSS